MKQRYRELTDALCFRAVRDCFKGKWARRDVSSVVEEYAGISKRAILAEQAQGGKCALKNEAIVNIGYEIQNRLERLLDGDENALELDPVVFRYEKDGMSQKVRKIAYCCIFHQIFDHLAALALMPLFHAKILPCQYASIPNRGQTGLKKHVVKILRKKSSNIRYAKKTDVTHAYETTMYSVIIEVIKKEIPSATWIITLLKALARMSPEGCLIIGGYLDAWLFNYLMSYVLRYALGQSKEKRGKKTYLIKAAVSFMDDFGYFGSREADINRDVRAVNAFLGCQMQLGLKDGKKTAFLSFEEEKKRRCKPSPAARGCPYFDIGGYQVHRGYVTIRKRIFLRLRRQYLRAAAEVSNGGSMCLQRAYAIIAYYGYIKNSHSKRVAAKLEVKRLHNIAKEVISHFARLKNLKEYKRRFYRYV